MENKKLEKLKMLHRKMTIYSEYIENTMESFNDELIENGCNRNIENAFDELKGLNKKLKRSIEREESNIANSNLEPKPIPNNHYKTGNFPTSIAGPWIYSKPRDNAMNIEILEQVRSLKGDNDIYCWFDNSNSSNQANGMGKAQCECGLHKVYGNIGRSNRHSDYCPLWEKA